MKKALATNTSRTGVVEGNGSPIADNRKAKVSDGEAILNAGATKALNAMLKKTGMTIDQFNEKHAPKGAETKMVDGVLHAAAGVGINSEVNSIARKIKKPDVGQSVSTEVKLPSNPVTQPLATQGNSVGNFLLGNADVNRKKAAAIENNSKELPMPASSVGKQAVQPKIDYSPDATIENNGVLGVLGEGIGRGVSAVGDILGNARDKNINALSGTMENTGKLWFGKDNKPALGMTGDDGDISTATPSIAINTATSATNPATVPTTVPTTQTAKVGNNAVSPIESPAAQTTSLTGLANNASGFDSAFTKGAGVSPQPKTQYGLSNVADNGGRDMATPSLISVTQNPVATDTRRPQDLATQPTSTANFSNGVGGTGSITSNSAGMARLATPESQARISKELATNADPAFQARMAQQADIVNQRIATRQANEAADQQARARNSLVATSQRTGNIGDRARRESALANLRMMDDNTQNSQANAMKQKEFAYGVGKDAKASAAAGAMAQQAQKNWESENQDKNLVYTPATYKLNPDTQQMELTDAQSYNKKTGEYKVIKQDKPQDLDVMIKNAQHYSQNGTPEQKKASLEFLAENGVK